MDALTVFTKTAKGIKEVNAGTALKRNEIAVLKQVDGKSTVSELATRVGGSAREAEATLVMLEKNGFIRVFETRAGEAAPEPEKEVDEFDFTTQMKAITSFSVEPDPPPAAPAAAAAPLSGDSKTEVVKATNEAEAIRLKAQEDVQRAQALRMETEIRAFEHAEAAMALRAEAEEHAKHQLKQALMLKEAAEKRAREDLERAAQLRASMQKQLAEAEEDNYRLREQLKAELAEVARLRAELTAQLEAAKRNAG